MAGRIPIIVDDRERRGGVVGALRASGNFAVAVRRLAVGDYLVDDRFLIERKTLPDLTLSIQSGRLFRQALRLAQVSHLRPALILEGTSADLRLKHAETGLRDRSEEHTSELQSQSNLVCRLLLEKKNDDKQAKDSHIGVVDDYSE